MEKRRVYNEMKKLIKKIEKYKDEYLQYEEQIDEVDKIFKNNRKKLKNKII